MPGERDDGDVGGAAADVHDHVAGGLGDRHAGADRCRHRLLDQVHFAGLRAVGAVLDRALLHLRDLARYADDNARAHPDVPVVRLLDEVGQHLLGDLEVGDDAVLHRLDRDDIAGRAAQHVLRVLADRLDAAVHLVDGDNRGFVHDDALPARVHAGIGGAEIDRQVTRKQRQHRTKTQTLTPSEEPACWLSARRRGLNTVLPAIFDTVHGGVGRLHQLVRRGRHIRKRGHPDRRVR